MPVSVFYSWVHDLPPALHQTFIEACINRALKELRKEGELIREAEELISADRDTRGETGSPPIVATIFKKIEKCSAFVADVSLINSCNHSRENGFPKEKCGCTTPTSNPNVMVEWGYAAGTIGLERVISVLNLATGALADLPFDIPDRRVVTYTAAVLGEVKTEERTSLVNKLKIQLKPLLNWPRAEELANQFFAKIAGTWRLEWGDAFSEGRSVDDPLKITADRKYLTFKSNLKTYVPSFDLTEVTFDQRALKVSFNKQNAQNDGDPTYPVGLIHSHESLTISADWNQMDGEDSGGNVLRYLRKA